MQLYRGQLFLRQSMEVTAVCGEHTMQQMGRSVPYQQEYLLLIMKCLHGLKFN